MKKAVVYLRTSTTEQHPENQLAECQQYAATHGYEIAQVFSEQESAWLQGHQHELAKIRADLKSGRRKYDALIVLALDRLTRGGGMELINQVHSFGKLGCKVISVKESGITDLPPELLPVVLSVIGFYAEYESRRKSQNIRLGQARARLNGTKSGKPIGGRGKDRVKHRRRAGYLLRYAGKKTIGNFQAQEASVD